jgi:S1-C subfamily serine protease
VPSFARGLNGARKNRPPFQGEQVQFEGRTTGHKTTVVSSHSPGLLWLDPLSQSKVQTPAAVNKGDSGSALVDDEDHVLGFAFRRTKTAQPIEFAEWIWAANALAALGLEPL